MTLCVTEMRKESERSEREREREREREGGGERYNITYCIRYNYEHR